MTRSMVWFLVLPFAVGLASGLWRSRRYGFSMRDVAIAAWWGTLFMGGGAIALFLSFAGIRLVNFGPVPTREALVAFPVFAAVWVTIISLWSGLPILAGSIVGLSWRFFVKRPMEQDDFEAPAC